MPSLQEVKLCLHLHKLKEQKRKNSNILDLPSGLDPNVAWEGEEHGIIFAFAQLQGSSAPLHEA